MAVFVVLGVLSAAMFVLSGPAEAAVTAVKGNACSYYTNVGLFGGPQVRLGCGQAANASANAAAVSVQLPEPGGSAAPLTATDVDGAKAQYGPAVIHGGLWPEDVASPPPSGPQSVSTQGTPASGTVTSSADITLKTPPFPEVPCYTGFTPPCVDPGGYGPPPVWGDSLHAECHASETAITGSTTLSNAFMATATDSGGAPLPEATEAIPDNPQVNFTLSGVITNVGDVFTTVFNEQIVNADGSLTVNAIHMYLFGPTAVGEVVRGQVTCGVTPSPLDPTDKVPPGCGTPVVEPLGPEDPTPKTPLTVREGMFDARGLQSVTVTASQNATVDVGSPDPTAAAYLRFVPGQTGPLPIVATRVDESQPMSFTVEAADAAGNKTTVSVSANGVDPPTSSCVSTFPDGTTTTSPQNTSTTPPNSSTTPGNSTTTPQGSTTTPRGSSTTNPGGSTTTPASGGVSVSPSTVAPGGTVQVSSSGWQPNSDVASVLRSDPVSLGTLRADAAGAVSGSLTIPASTPAGAHTLELSGTGADGSPRTVSAALTVTDASGGGGPSPAGSGGPVQASPLSRTGFDLQPFASLGMLTLALGALFVAVGRRRQAHGGDPEGRG